MTARGTLAALLASLLLAACAVPEEGAMGPVVIPFRGIPEQDSIAAAIYQSVLQQCRDAYRDKDAGRLRSLLDQYDRTDAPGWAREQFAGLRRMHEALRFSQSGLASAVLACDQGRVAVGEPIPLVLVLQSGWEEPILIEADGATALFLKVLVTSEDPTGTIVTQKLSLNVPLAKEIRLLPGAEHREAFTFPARVTGAGVLHSFEFTGELAPVRVVCGGQQLGVHRMPLRSCTVRVLPKGFEAAERAPFTTLKRALELGDAAHFAHAYLACEFMPANWKGPAGDRLIESMRTRGPELVAVAIACMRKLFGRPDRSFAGLTQPLSDGDDWIQWWREHRTEFPSK